MNWLFEKFSFRNSILRLWHWKFVIIKEMTYNMTLQHDDSSVTNQNALVRHCRRTFENAFNNHFDLTICYDLSLLDHSEAVLLVSLCLLRRLLFLMIVLRLSWLNSLTFQNQRNHNQRNRQRSNILHREILQKDNAFSHSNRQLWASCWFYIEQ